MNNIFTNREDYVIEHHGSHHVVFLRGNAGSTLGRVLANFNDGESAERFVWRRTHPRDYPATFFDDICRCGWTERGWDYVTTEGLTYELCNSCKNPLRDYILKDIQKKQLADFSLDDFLNL